MTWVVKFTVPGPPVGKGRPQFSKTPIVRRTKAGKIQKVHTRTPQKTRDYERRVQFAAMAAMQKLKGKITVPIRVETLVVLPRPKRLNRKCDDPGLIPIDSCAKPDIDNVRKAILDALKPWLLDDALVVAGEGFKCYAESADWSDKGPRVVVRIEPETRNPNDWAEAKGMQ